MVVNWKQAACLHMLVTVIYLYAIPYTYKLLFWPLEHKTRISASARVLNILNHFSDHNSRRKAAAAKLIQSYWRFYSYIKTNREHLAWKRMRQIAHVKKLKNNLYAKLHEWREYKKMNGNICFEIFASLSAYLNTCLNEHFYLADHWYKEFIADDIAMMVTDVSRAVDKIQFTLNRIGYSQFQGKRPSTQVKREFVKESTIYEEDEVGTGPFQLKFI